MKKELVPRKPRSFGSLSSTGGELASPDGLILNMCDRDSLLGECIHVRIHYLIIGVEPFIKSRPSTTNLMAPPDSPECLETLNLIENSPEPESPQSDHRPETPQSGTSSHATRSSRNKTNLQDLYDLMKSSHDLRVHKHHSKQQDMDETDLFF
ncbi:hypothetical protein EVAR_10455_1 [Eumeta japonica]|uniref:Uncharacterized protein n=1 Tax=Eumeta variegata TaxID=151549 RepID=A0A4C1THC4_EUMVA|nr:hypothetical protein EVAR_10455_1 [Eumeta japonica]